MKIWLDDIRNPCDFGFPDYVWLKTAQEVIDILPSITHISFDHDLGDCPETGYTVACEIERLVFEGKMKCPIWHVHSANPVGRENIKKAMENAENMC